MARASRFRDRADDGLLTLVGDLPGLIRNLIVAEVNAAKRWVGRTLKDGGIGTVWMIVALFFLFWAIPVFGVILIAGGHEWWGWPIWLSALVALGVLVLMAVIAVVFGILRFKKLFSRENPVSAAKHDATMVKEIADEL